MYRVSLGGFVICCKPSGVLHLKRDLECLLSCMLKNKADFVESNFLSLFDCHERGN